MQKLYCYVDESGQDTHGRIFVVALVVLTSGKQKDELFALCEQVEIASGKGKTKWGKSKSSHRLEYLRRIFAASKFYGRLRYAVFSHNTNYDLATLIAIAKAVHWEKLTDFTTLIYVDGLSKTKRQEYATELRKLKVPIHKVRGVAKDENNALIRLADTLAGFIRDVLEGKAPDGQELFTQAKASEALIEV
jgi:hypothetical protein